MTVTTYPSPLGPLQLTFSQNALCRIEYGSRLSAKITSHPLRQATQQALNDYFKNPTYSFKLALELTGTPFQKKVWRALQKIPSGTVLTYGDLAKQLKTSPRAIGNACRSNPLPIIIPCHRVVAQNHLGGYAGSTQGKLFNIKKWLLQHEGYEPSHRTTRHR